MICKVLTEKLFVVTSDFKLLYKVLQIKIDNIQFIHQLPTDMEHTNGRIITDTNEFGSSPKILKINRNMTRIQLKKKIIQFLIDFKPKWDLIIGIDPGVNIGIAMLYKKQLIDSTIVLSLDRLIRWIRNNIALLHASNILIRIGDGVENSMNNIIERLLKEYHTSITIEIVDETNTSIKQVNDITIHEQAAIRIANRVGNVYEPKN